MVFDPNFIFSVVMQMPFALEYTKDPLFDMVSSMIVLSLIAIGMNYAFQMVRKKTTDMGRMKKVMNETKEWRKQYTDAIKKQDKVRVEELKKKQAYVNKMTMEMQQQQMRPMLIYMMPSFLVWIFVFPSVFGPTTAVSPITFPLITCNEENVKLDQQVDESGQAKGACTVPGEVFLWGWFLITSFAVTGVISKITGTSMPLT